MGMTEEKTVAPPPRRRTARWLALAATLVLVLAVVYLTRFAGRTGRDPSGPARMAAPVELIRVPTMDIVETVRGVGTLQAIQSVELRPEISGIISAIHFTEGSLVESNQVLVELRANKLHLQLAAQQAALRSATVRFDNASRQFHRHNELHAAGLLATEDAEGTRAEFDAAAAEVDRLESEVALVREQLRDMQIRAPFGGRIAERRFDRGAYVTPADSLARLYQVSTLELAMSLPERYTGRLEPGQQVRLTVAAIPGEVFAATVSFVSPAITEASRDVLVKATVPNSDGRLWPGSFANALLTLDLRPQRPVVPEQAIVATRTGYLIFVVENDVAHARRIETGLRHEGWVEVLSGVRPGEAIVSAGHMRLSGGDAVRVVSTEAIGGTSE
jgi:membrane fusion protein, multidrug efflux system